MKLTELIAQYVAFRKNLGQDFESNRKRLAIFSRFVGEGVEIDSVKPSRVAAFLTAGKPGSRYCYLKYGTLRGFFNYAPSLAVISRHHPYPPRHPNSRLALFLISIPVRICGGSSTEQCRIRNTRRES
jgi:hypothetical protein